VAQVPVVDGSVTELLALVRECDLDVAGGAPPA
jgi:hypothetical protein